MKKKFEISNHEFVELAEKEVFEKTVQFYESNDEYSYCIHLESAHMILSTYENGDLEKLSPVVAISLKELYGDNAFVTVSDHIFNELKMIAKEADTLEITQGDAYLYALSFNLNTGVYTPLFKIER